MRSACAAIQVETPDNAPVHWTRTHSLKSNRAMNRLNLNQFAEQLLALLPASAGLAQEELRQSIKVFMEGALARMNLVTREEFDAQAALLARTREKLDRLEALVSEMEAAASN